MSNFVTPTQKKIIRCTVQECQNVVTTDLEILMPRDCGPQPICSTCQKSRKSCTLCGCILSLKYFSPDSKMKRGYRSRCKQCENHLKRGYSAEMIRKNFPRIDEDGHKHTHRHDLCDTELAMGQPIAGDDCECQLCWDSRTGKLLS